MSVFRFKQFVIDQSGCAMKINTDGVLLGALASSGSPLRILDIGTGTGVIALMVAQRFPSAMVDAIEIDATAAHAACENFKKSVFAARIFGQAVALSDFEPAGLYDLIVSNPPYFLRSLKNHDVRKQIARHADASFFAQLLERSVRWLTPTGSLQLILPVALADELVRKAVREYGMIRQWEQNIRSFSSQPPIRRIVSIGKSPGGYSRFKADFVIYESKGVYSPAYRELLKDFFLAF